MAPTAKDICVVRAAAAGTQRRQVQQGTTTAAAARTNRQQQQKQCSWRRRGSSGSTMSDADTESCSSGARYSWRHASVTSSESDGPRIVVQTTSEDEDTSADITLLKVAAAAAAAASESVTTTDMGSDGTSEGCDEDRLLLLPEGESSVEEVPPELAADLVTQVEEYLSDEGLARDLFLLKHVKRHRDGFVSLKLLSGYKKVKKLSRDWRVLSLALQESQRLELNDTATKVRRRDPLPCTLLYDAPASRALVAVNIPPHQATMAQLAVLFGNYGPVASLQVVRPRPDGSVPPPLQRLPEVSTCHCAVVEYEDVWGAARALHHMPSSSNITLHVLRRSRRPSHSSSRTSPTPTSTPRGRSGSSSNSHGWPEHHGVSPEELRQRLKGTRSRQQQQQVESSASESDDKSNNYVYYSCRRRSHQLLPQALPRHLVVAPRTASSVPASPRAPRRRNDYSTHVMRDPKGPDGTRGFSRKRS